MIWLLPWCVLAVWALGACIATGVIARRFMRQDGDLDRTDRGDVTMLCLLALIIALYWPVAWPLDSLARRVMREQREDVHAL